MGKMATVNSDEKSKRKKIRNLTPSRFLKAIPGTGGVKTRIAERLDCAWSTVNDCLKKEKGNWPKVRQAYEDECQKVGDLAEIAVQEVIEKGDHKDRTKNARWYLARKHRDRGFADVTKVQHEGGDTPVQIESTNLALEDLDLPLPVRKQILAALQKKRENAEMHSRKDKKK